MSENMSRGAAIFGFRLCLIRPDICKGTPFYEHFKWINEHIDELKGKDLACFCREGEPCHGDVLINFIKEKYESKN
jgi:hypothetical protein